MQAAHYWRKSPIQVGRDNPKMNGSYARFDGTYLSVINKSDEIAASPKSNTKD